jgi:hypothetical protein
MDILYDKNAVKNAAIEKTVKEFLDKIETLEKLEDLPVTVVQDGVKKSYYIRCAISGRMMNKAVSLDARLNPESGETFRDNREILETNNTFLRMKTDAENEREFNDIMAEYITSYIPEKPLKIWGVPALSWTPSSRKRFPATTASASILTLPRNSGRSLP